MQRAGLSCIVGFRVIASGRGVTMSVSIAYRGGHRAANRRSVKRGPCRAALTQPTDPIYIYIYVYTGPLYIRDTNLLTRLTGAGARRVNPTRRRKFRAAVTGRGLWRGARPCRSVRLLRNGGVDKPVDAKWRKIRRTTRESRERIMRIPICGLSRLTE